MDRFSSNVMFPLELIKGLTLSGELPLFHATSIRAFYESQELAALSPALKPPLKQPVETIYEAAPGR